MREPHPIDPYPPLVINACLTGMIPTKEQTPHVPITPEEVVADAVRVFDAGARIVHVHAREDDGKPTWKGRIYERIIRGIRRERPECLVCASTSGRNWPEAEKRMEVLELDGDAKPDMASLTLGSLNFPGSASVNAPDMIQRLAGRMQERGIRPELEVFDVGMVGYGRFLEKRGLVRGRKYFNLLLGSLGQAPATIGALALMVAELPGDSFWSGCGIGKFQLPMNAAAIVAGGGVRVGIEDSIHFDYDRKRLATNEDLVRRVVRIAEEVGRRVATPAEARELAGIA